MMTLDNRKSVDRYLLLLFVVMVLDILGLCIIPWLGFVMVGILLFAFLVLAACISVVTLDLWYFEITCTSEKLIIRNQHPLIRRTQVLQVEIPLRMLCHFVIVDRRFMSILKIGMQDKEGRLMPFRFYMIAFQQGEKVQSMTASLYIYISDIQSQN